MYRSERLTRSAAVIVLALIVSACGGGGDDAAPQSSPPPPPTWRGAVAIEVGNAGVADLKLAVDRNGNAIAVWVQDGDATTATRYDVWANRYNAATAAWGSAQLIETANAGGASGLDVAMDDAGNAIVVWSQDGDTTSATIYDIWANRYDAVTGTWGTARLLESGSGQASAVRIAVSRGGEAMAVWQQESATGLSSIWSNRFSAGSWAGAQLVDGDEGAGRHAYFPHVAIDSNGNAIAVWHQWDGARYNLWARRHVPGSGWLGEQTVESGVGNALHGNIAIGTDGTAIAVWQQSNGTRDDVMTNRFAGTWGTAEIIDSGTDDAYSPAVAIDSNGNAFAIWYQNDDAVGWSVRHVWTNRFNAATGWETAIRLAENAGTFPSPALAMTADGAAFAVWVQWDGTRSNIDVRRYVAGSGWIAAERIETSDQDAYAPQVGADAGGNAVALWGQSDGSALSAFVNHYR